MSMFAETSKGMQTLRDVVQDFTAWCGMKVNIKFVDHDSQGSKAKGKHASTRSEHKLQTSQNARHQ